MARLHLPIIAPRRPSAALRGPAEPALSTLAPRHPSAALRGPAEPALSIVDLIDGFARQIRYLRVSVTDRCNYRCAYCMPESLEDRMQFQPRAAVLTFE